MRSLMFAGVTCALLSACGGDSAPTQPINDPGTTTVDVFTPGLVFSPAFLTVNVGTTVRWNITGVAHDVTFAGSTAGTPQSIPVTTNAVISRTFNSKGSFPYDCRTHPGMSGSVTVQ
ncbi:MAG: plastocyanin/azurin family copper-binding protein [Gemmatimonadota bacterium]|nr:plastocyanin/azurin family copper-binding protein [Gemmatimonadota bacterium]